ncbi:MAG: cupin [Cellulosilyticum sp.]|nr:cupin [Cellulosilyticum sp.]
MNTLNLFEQFNNNGKLILPNETYNFDEIAWSKHPTFEGVELKHIVTGSQTTNAFSYHLVRIAPHKKIAMHTHPLQLETHEIIAGSGYCLNNGVRLNYIPGTISIFPMNVEHEVTAHSEGLYLFAKFIPALC